MGLGAKRRYDEKRKGTAHRAIRERARGRCRSIPKTGKCEKCKEEGKTVWHHIDYETGKEVIELCYRCHRKEHPRDLFGTGKVK